MKECAVCRKPLLTSLDEYGPIQSPVCLSHFWVSQAAGTELDRNEAESKELEEQISDLEDQLEELKDEQRRLKKMLNKPTPTSIYSEWPLPLVELSIGGAR